MHYISREKGYFLPLSYNDNKVVLLVRDPYCLFAYWEIASEKRQSFIKQFGEDSWNNSRPVIKLTNITRNNIEYINIDDFASSWYINVNDSNCIYTAEIGRIFENNMFVMFAESNSAFTPNSSVASIPTVVFANYNNVAATTVIEEKTEVKSQVNEPSESVLGKYDFASTKGKISLGLSSAEFSESNIINGVSSESFIK